MLHGRAVAELWLLLRDCLAFEDGERLVLLGGVPPDWFQSEQGMAVQDMPTQFGKCSFRHSVEGKKAVLTLFGKASSPRGFVLRMPKSLVRRASVDGEPLAAADAGDIAIPNGAQQIEIRLDSR